MDRRRFLAMAALPALYPLQGRAQTRRTELTIKGDAFLINGRPTDGGAVGLPGHETVGSRPQHDRVRGRDARVEATRRARLHDQPAGRQPRVPGRTRERQGTLALTANKPANTLPNAAMSSAGTGCSQEIVCDVYRCLYR